jgi:hypothetical protein
MIGRVVEMSKIFRVLDEAVVQRHSAIVPVLGPYGMGKTFTFLQLRERFRARASPFKDTPIISAYVTATKEKFPSKYSFYVYTNSIEEIGEAEIVALSQRAKPGEGTEFFKFLREADFRAAVANIKSGQDGHQVWNWLRGGPVPQKGETEFGIYARISGDVEALRMMMDICRLAAHAKYGAFVLLIDELEQAFAQGSAYTKAIVWVRQWYDAVNREISESQEGIVPAITMLGCAPETWTAITAAAEKGKGRGEYGQIRAFLERIPRENYVELGPLDLPDVEKLLQSFLSKVIQKGHKPSSPLYPFDRDSAKMIFDISQGVPRHVIRIARILLREADLENKPIDKNNAERWLRRAKIATE